jgi:hypothetical protein
VFAAGYKRRKNLFATALEDQALGVCQARLVSRKP